MKGIVSCLLILTLLLSVFVLEALALSDTAKVTIVVVDEKGLPVEGALVGMGFEKNTLRGTESAGRQGKTGADGSFVATGDCNGHITYGADKQGYYNSNYEFDFIDRGPFGWKPWNPELKVVLRKIVNPVPMYARNTRFSKIKIPVVGKKVMFDLIKFDWVEPYGRGVESDIAFTLNSKINSIKDYGFTLSIECIGEYNGIIEYSEDVSDGSEFPLPRYAPIDGYEKQIYSFDRMIKGVGRQVSSKQNRHYIFRVRSVVDKNKEFVKAMYGKILGDIRVGPQESGSAYIEFKYYLNPDYTRNLEYDPEHNLFEPLPPLEQVGIK